jgi:hypothetical protein
MFSKNTVAKRNQSKSNNDTRPFIINTVDTEIVAITRVKNLNIIIFHPI